MYDALPFEFTLLMSPCDLGPALKINSQECKSRHSTDKRNFYEERTKITLTLWFYVRLPKCWSPNSYQPSSNFVFLLEGNSPHHAQTRLHCFWHKYALLGGALHCPHRKQVSCWPIFSQHVNLPIFSRSFGGRDFSVLNAMVPYGWISLRNKPCCSAGLHELVRSQYSVTLNLRGATYGTEKKLSPSPADVPKNSFQNSYPT